MDDKLTRTVDKDGVTRTVQTATLYANTDEPVVIEFKETKGGKRDVHMYKVLSPDKYAGRKEGCTGVTGFKDKSANLMQWAANLAVQAKADGRSDEEARYAHRNAKDKAADIGTRVHDWIEQHLKGNDAPYDKDMKASVEGYLRWEAERKPKTLWSERIVYSKAHDYAGKLDWGGELDGRYGLIDFKTGGLDKEYNSYRKSYTGRVRAKSDHYIQDAGYDIPISEEDGREAEFYGVLYIPITGDVQYFETAATAECRSAFLNTLNAKRAWKSVEERNPYGAVA